MDQTELERLYRKLEKSIYNVVYRRLWNAEDAHDVVQESFVRLWDARARVDRLTAEPFVYRIALNLATSRLRKRRRWAWVPIDPLREALAARPADPIGDEDRARVRRAVEALPEDLRTVVLLCELSELTYEQIGRVLSIPAGTVGSRRHRALVALRRALGAGDLIDERAVPRPV
jgi:RNA polymerase sigma-70 factor (ECF subfamily)